MLWLKPAGNPPNRSAQAWRLAAGLSGQTVFVLTHQLHGEVIACDRTNDGESLACPPVYDVRVHDQAETVVHGLSEEQISHRRDRR